MPAPDTMKNFLLHGGANRNGLRLTFTDSTQITDEATVVKVFDDGLLFEMASGRRCLVPFTSIQILGGV